MTRTWKLLLCMVIVLSAAALAQAQALGDIARKERTKQKPQAARTYTNEDIPSVDIPKDVPKDSGAAAEATSADGDKKDAAAGEKKETPADEKTKLNAEWKAKVAAQQARVADIEREINLMQREERLKVAVYYSDAASRLQNSKQWTDDEKKFQDDLTARQKDLAGAKAALEEAREAARKAGASRTD